MYARGAAGNRGRADARGGGSDITTRQVSTGGAPEKFGERIRNDYGRWLRVVKETGIKAE